MAGIASVFLGVAVNFGVAGTSAITGTGIGTFKLQSQDHTKSADKETIRDGDGVECQASIYNQTETATFEYFVSAATVAAAITATTIPAIGTIVTVVNATKYPAIAGAPAGDGIAAPWFVWDDPKIGNTNTTAFKVTLSLKRWTAVGGIAAVST